MKLAITSAMANTAIARMRAGVDGLADDVWTGRRHARSSAMRLPQLKLRLRNELRAPAGPSTVGVFHTRR